MSEDTTEVNVTELQAELEKVRKALKDVNAEVKAHREAKEAAEARVSQLESDDSVKVWKDKALQAEVKAALRDQGVKDTGRVMKVLDLEGVDIDDDGKLTGFDEKVTSTKKDWPELFDAKRAVGGSADIFADTAAKPKMTSTEAQVARIFS